MASSAQASPASLPLHPDPVRQHGAYALIGDPSGRVLLVRADTGRCYLPGGRIEPGEDAPAALAREIEEECGLSAAIEARLGKARQRIMAGSVDLDATYWRARLGEPRGRSGEHELLWVTADAALDLLHRPGDRAIVLASLRNGVESVA
ncbi:MAG TPA: NUDIX domain-containing protein [Allosphingosinicella sp.]